MNMQTNIKIETKANKDANPVETNLTIDWEGMEVEDIRALAQQALVVKVQSGWRKNGIPAGDHSIKATDFKVGVRAPKQAKDIAAMIASLSPEQKAELMAKLAAA